MNLHKVIVRPGIRTSEKFGALNFLYRDLFYGLLSAANQKSGWFEANPTVLRAALYAPCLGKVSERDLSDGLLKLREVRLIKLWTGKNGRAYGQIIKYEQAFDYGEALPADGHPPGDDELPLEAAAPMKKRIEGSGVEFARRAKRPAPTPVELQEDWLARLAGEWPGVNVLAELEAAKKKKAGKVERVWFETHWLPHVSPAVEFSGANGGKPVEPEPEAWRAYLKDNYEGEEWAETAALREWAELPAHWRAKIAREIARGTLNA